MISRRILIVITVVLAATSGLYAAVEFGPPAMTRVSGHAQHLNITYAESAEKYWAVIEGTITDVRVKVFVEERTRTDEDGNTIVHETLHIPRTQVTIEVEEVLKGDPKLSSKDMVVYDRHVSDAIGKIDGVRARFVSQMAYDYQVGEKGIFMIENDHGIWINGFTKFYPIIDGKSTIESAYDRKYHKEPIDLEYARDAARQAGS